MMRLDVGVTYRLKNGEFAHIRQFDPGIEGQTLSTFHGSVKGHGFSNWRPDGINLDTPEWDVVKVATQAEQVAFQSSPSDATE